MKSTLFRYSLLLTLALSHIIGYSKPGQDELKKKYEKTFKAAPESTLNISNKFGRVEINNWNKSEFKIEVEVIVEGKSDRKAQELLESIEIDFSQSGQNVYCKTELDNHKNNGNGNSFEINYTIYMPETNALDITNSFGDVSMGDRLSDLRLDVSYGSFRVGKVSGFADIALSFGKGSSISKIEKGDITVKYSDLELDEADQLEIECGYSDVELGKVGKLELEAKYGKVQIEDANTIEAEVRYTGFEIEILRGSLELESSYVGNFTIERLEPTFTLVDIEGKYGSYDIGLAPGINANIEAEFSFSDLRIDSDIKSDFHYRVKESNKSYYKGKIGSGHPDKWIKIESGYGSARIKTD